MVIRVQFAHVNDWFEGGHNKRDTGKTREDRREKTHVFTCFFFACDGGGAIDLPQHFQFFLLLDAVSSTFSQVDVTQPAEKCSKLQREAKNGHVIEGQRLFL